MELRCSLVMNADSWSIKFFTTVIFILCFWAKIGKIIYTPVNITIPYIKWGFPGCSLHRLVNRWNRNELGSTRMFFTYCMIPFWLNIGLWAVKISRTCSIDKLFDQTASVCLGAGNDRSALLNIFICLFMQARVSIFLYAFRKWLRIEVHIPIHVC